MNDKNKVEKKVLVIGATVIDVIMELEELPKSGQDITARQKGRIVGGCGFNVAAVLKYFQLPMDFLTPVGKGENGVQVQATLKEIASTGHVSVLDGDNGWNLSLVENSGERTFITVPGIETSWRQEWFRSVNFTDYTYIYVSGYELEGSSGEVILQVLKERVTNQTIVFDPGPRLPFIRSEIWQELLKFPLIFTINQDESDLLCKVEHIETQVKEIFQVIQAPIIIRRGEKGAVGYDGEKLFHALAPHTEVVDTIGAGDAHTGALISGLCMGRSLEESVQLANHIASQVVGQQGGRLAGVIGTE